MKWSGISLLLMLVFCLASTTRCRNKTAEPNPELNNLALLRGDVILCSSDEFGKVSFGLSCKFSVRQTFDLAVALLHSFEYEEAEKAFVQVIDADPECAMAYWGVAMSLYHALWMPPSAEQLKKGEEVLKIAKTIQKTEREQAYLDAIGLYYQDWQTVDAKTRAMRMLNKMEQIYATYKDDTEAAIFYALALNATADPVDKNFTNQKKAGAILEPIFLEQPNHPGIAHYIIHSYDNPVLAEKALNIAKKYASIAPASAHAQHMPSHIFIQLGMWDESINSNLKSTEAALCYAESAGYTGHWDEELHGMDYLVYAYLQKGENKKATELLDYLKSIERVDPINFKDAYALVAIPARIALENKDWKMAANLEFPPIQFPWEQFPWQKSMVHFARALGASHLGNKKQAQKEILELESMHQKLLGKGNAYEANQVLIQVKTAKAWLQFARRNNNEAITLMREAVDMEDHTTKHPVTPCEVLPTSELLADMYLAMNNDTEALKAYEKDLREHPNRFNGLYGAAVAASNLRQTEKARTFYEKLIQQAADSDRSELKKARKVVEK